jgi:hypothetical protein
MSFIPNEFALSSFILSFLFPAAEAVPAGVPAGVPAAGVPAAKLTGVPAAVSAAVLAAECNKRRATVSAVGVAVIVSGLRDRDLDYPRDCSGF